MDISNQNEGFLNPSQMMIFINNIAKNKYLIIFKFRNLLFSSIGKKLLHAKGFGSPDISLFIEKLLENKHLEHFDFFHHTIEKNDDILKSILDEKNFTIFKYWLEKNKIRRLLNLIKITNKNDNISKLPFEILNEIVSFV